MLKGDPMWVIFFNKMAFNEQGVWVELNPYEAYQQRVIKSKMEPGSGSVSWTSDLRTEMHNAAARFVMARDGIIDTPENLSKTREKITKELEEVYDCDERNGFLKPKIYIPQEDLPSSRFYKHNGD